MSYEVEQKFRVVDAADLQRRLAALGVRFDRPLVQVDLYLAHPARDFAQTDEALRIRRVGEENFVTYKGPKLDATTKTRREIELPLPGGAAPAARYTELFEALGFRPVAEVRKQRRRGELTWQGHDVEISWDEVEGLGPYVELEVVVEAAQLAAAKDCVASLAVELQLAHNERRSYLEMLLSTPSRPYP